MVWVFFAVADRSSCPTAGERVEEEAGAAVGKGVGEFPTSESECKADFVVVVAGSNWATGETAYGGSYSPNLLL